MPQRQILASSRIFATFLLCTRAMIYLDIRRLGGCRQQQMQLLAVRSRDRSPAWRSCTCAFSPHNLGLFFSLISNWNETTNSPSVPSYLKAYFAGRIHSSKSLQKAQWKAHVVNFTAVCKPIGGVGSSKRASKISKGVLKPTPL